MVSYGPLAIIYDELTTDINYLEFADFYESKFRERKKSIKTLLDIGCGTGTLTLILAKRGYDIIGADSSEDMLCVAQEKSLELQDIIKPLFLCQSMTELDLHGTVNAAISSLDTVNYLPPEDMSKFFQLLHLFIDPGGLLVFDIISPERLISLDGSISTDEDDNKLCLWRSEYDSGMNALIYYIDIFTRQFSLWHRSFEEHIEYVHKPDNLILQLEQAGFNSIEVISDGPQKELGRIFIIAKNN